MLQAVLHEALAAFLAVLDRFSLADLVAPRAQLATLLGIGNLTVFPSHSTRE